MASTDFASLAHKQRQFFLTGTTREAAFRDRALAQLAALVAHREDALLKALKEDLGKGDFESYYAEIGFLFEEIKGARRHLRQWARPRRVSSPWYLAIGRSEVRPEPKGSVAILGPWNYPMQLVLSPLVGALAAGCTAVLKPSELAPATSRVLEEAFREGWDPNHVAVVTGDGSVSAALLEQPWDHIFFTGGGAIGQKVMAAAARHLTSVTLELGGKSPCFIDDENHWPTTFHRITWGKFSNAGQTCVAPDYLLVPRGKEALVVEGIRGALRKFFGPDPRLSPDYGRIVSERHWDRLVGLLGRGKVEVGGEHDRASRYLAPTVVTGVTWEDPVMGEEIFGPILPVLAYDRWEDALDWVRRRPRPLACYVFSSRRERISEVLELPFGGGCVNDTLLHLANPKLPFGGTGPSGMGAYHGRYSFDTFTHYKSVFHHSPLYDSSLRYPPFGQKARWLRRLFRP